MTNRPRLGISRCLLGDNVRHDGGHKLDSSLVSTLSLMFEFVPVCPEVELGMGIPREPIHLVAADDGVPVGASLVRLQGVTSRTDWTQSMAQFSSQRVDDLARQGLSGYVLKAGSPSCGLVDVPVEDGQQEGAIGRGLFAEVLVSLLPDLPIDDEQRLADLTRRAAFIQRVFAYHERSAR